MSSAYPYGGAFMSPPVSSDKKKGKKKEDPNEIAGYLLSLKHSRSVSPEPNDSQQPSFPDVMSGYSVKGTGKQTGYMGGPPESLAGPGRELAPTQGLEINIEELIKGSTLVFAKDRGLVPDALFIAMAQMKPVRLTQADRVGCYKTRDIGFLGMACKHCGGQPGFGRYFPNSVRSLAQTTTSQTILKHIGSKCRFCTPEVRNAVLELQRIQHAQDGIAAGRPRYGSRKIFFQRVWSRLHGNGEEPDEEEKAAETRVSIEEVVESVVDDVDETEKRKTGRYGSLPTSAAKPKKIKLEDVVVENTTEV